MVTLEDIVTAAGIPTKSQKAVLAISVGPTRQLYVNCMVPTFAPPFPVNVGVKVLPSEEGDLKRLLPGKTIFGSWDKTGDCAAELPDDAECTFHVQVNWAIRRSKPGDQFP